MSRLSSLWEIFNDDFSDDWILVRVKSDHLVIFTQIDFSIGAKGNPLRYTVKDSIPASPTSIGAGIESDDAAATVAPVAVGDGGVSGGTAQSENTLFGPLEATGDGSPPADPKRCLEVFEL